MMEKDSGKLHTYFATNCAFLYSDTASNFAFIDDTSYDIENSMFESIDDKHRKLTICFYHDS